MNYGTIWSVIGKGFVFWYLTSSFQNWRGNVKTRLFVLTLRDHFREKAMDAKKKAQHDDQDNADTGDTWALDYLGGSWTRIQPMMEAFDDDASGYISITEVNQFIELCPPELNWR